jgi:hypothetical protein
MRWVVGSNHVGVRGADVIGGVGMHTYSIDIEPQMDILCRLSRSLLLDCSWSAYISFAVACGGYGDKGTP